MSQGESRRDFLQTVLAGTALAALPKVNVASEKQNPPNEPPVVVRISSPTVVSGGSVHKTLFRQLLTDGMLLFTGASSLTESWRKLVSPDETFALKFNRSAQSAIGTTETVAETIIESLFEAGISPGNLYLIEAPRHLPEKFATALVPDGYDDQPVHFGSAEDRLMKVVSTVDAIINIPYLKAHSVAGMSCGLKNLAFGVIKHPARFHVQRCSPFVADIAALPQLQKKHRLTIVDALRVVFDGGPSAKPETIHDAGTLLFGTDPVAVDAIGENLLDQIRVTQGLTPLKESGGVPYLDVAHARGLGERNIRRIRVLPEN